MIDYKIPDTAPTITAGEIRRLIKDMPDDRPVTILVPNGGWWLNIIGFQNNDGTGANPDEEPSAMFVACDDFSTTQW